MRKRRSLLIAVMVIVATAATLFVGCKKEKDEAVTHAERSEAQALLNRIEAFQTLRDAVNSGAKASGSMTVEEMRETLCLVSNYEHSEHETYCLNTTLDTLRVPMPVVIDGNVSEADVVATYTAFEEALQECMESINDEMVVPSLFSIVLPKIGSKDEDDINIIFTRGQEAESEPINSPMASGPFNDICYYWGLDMGRCDGGLSTTTDAADELTRYFKFDYSPYNNGMFGFLNIEYVSYVATNDFSVYHPEWTYWEPTTYATGCDTWLFWHYGVLGPSDPEPCLCEDELNCEYVGIKTNVALTSGEKYYSPIYHLPFFECYVRDYMIQKTGSQPHGRVHVAYVVYANFIYTPNQG